MSRRAKITVKPNLSIKTITPPKPSPTLESIINEDKKNAHERDEVKHQISPSIKNVNNFDISIENNNIVNEIVDKIPENNVNINDKKDVLKETIKVSEGITFSETHVIQEDITNDLKTISVKELNLPVPDRESRASSVCSMTSTVSEERRKRRKMFTGREELDPSKFTMMDLIYWNPKSEKGLDKDKFKIPKLVNLEPRPLLVKKEEDIVGPRVKIDEDGKLIIDEESLVVKQQADNNIWETVDEDRLPRKITSLSFRKNKVIRRSHVWTDEETDLFYEILQATGPDFTIMHQFFPTKARAELKAKYNREERYNSIRLSCALNNPAMMDDILLEKCLQTADELEKLKKEAAEEKEKKAKELAEAREKRKEAKLLKLKALEEANNLSLNTSDIETKPIIAPKRKVSKTNGKIMRKRRIIEDDDEE
uniref:Myb_DNA-bind_7 domain-containing protein n=1 Tax=Parastrongyloides trichosuri TaxID=131310 RepID=A0A0N4ZNL5_PARTI